MCESNHIVMGYKNNTELFHNVWCIYSICDRAKVHNDCNFDYNKPHRHTSMYTDSTFCTAGSWILIVESDYSDMKPQFCAECSSLVGIT